MNKPPPLSRDHYCPEGAAQAYASIQAGRFDDAIGLSNELLAANSDCFDALRLGAAARLLSGQDRDAMLLLKLALRRQPNAAEVSRNLSVDLQDDDVREDALGTPNEVVAPRRDTWQALLNSGMELLGSYRLEEATAVCERALGLDYLNSHAYYALGNTLVEGGRLGLALACYERALIVDPRHRDALENFAHLLLLSGDFRRGWRAQEARFRRDSYRTWPGLPSTVAKWNGKLPIEARLILVAEQGLGDVIQFVRYAQLLKKEGLAPTLQCHPRLVRLLKSISFLEDVVPFGTVPNDREALWFPLMSLPLLAGTQLTTIPHDVPYLNAERALIAKWRAWLGAGSALRVGIAWQGNPQAETGHLRDRSVPLREFASLARIPNVKLISLQRGPGVEQLQEVDFAPGIVVPEPELDSGPDGFTDTAALMTQLDLIVTSDTSTAHLAGALGRPVWVALKHAPDWRWLLEREDSPWYPTMRLFRQRTPGRWGPVFSSIAQELRHLQLNRVAAL